MDFVFTVYFIILTLPGEEISVGQQDSVLVRLDRQNPVLSEERADGWNEFFDLQVVENERLKQAQFFTNPIESSLTPIAQEVQELDH
jgi:hypothetical protein